MTVHDGVLQLGGSADGSVLRKIRLDRGNGCILDVLGRGEVGLAGAEIHNVNPLLAQLLGLAHHHQGCGGLNAIDAFRQAHGMSYRVRYWAHVYYGQAFFFLDFFLPSDGVMSSGGSPFANL